MNEPSQPQNGRPLAVPNRELSRQKSTPYAADYGFSSLPSYPSGVSPKADRFASSASFLDYWRILRLHQGTWLVFAFLGALLGLLITLPQTPIYQAKTAIEIQSLNDNFMNMRQTTQVYEGGAGTDSSEIPTQIRILQSDTVMEQVVKELQKKGIVVSESSRLSAWRRLLNIPAPDQANSRDRLLGDIVGSIRARATGQTRVIEITADSPDPKLASEFLNTLTDKFIERNLESRLSQTEKTAEWLSRQLNDMRIKLERSEDSLQQYARQSGLLFTDEKTNVSEEKLKQLQQELSTATAARISRQSTFELAQRSTSDALPDVLNDAALQETSAKIRDLRAQIASMSATYTPDYPRMKRAQAELAALQLTFDRDRAAILARIQNEYQDAARREQLLEAAYTEQTRQVTGQGEKAIQYNILKREVDSNRQLYDSMLAQLKQSSIATAMRANNIRVVDMAKAPLVPYKPDIKQSILVGAFGGVFLGGLFIISRFRADRTIQQPNESTLYLGVPELGIIPHAPKQKTLDPSQPAPKFSVELATLDPSSTAVSEGFRSALISVLFSEGDLPDAKTRTLVLTSPSPGEGKSTIASNLAITIAELGRKVLLIDADMRRPRQHDVFRINNDAGLSTLLKNRTPLDGDVSLGGLIRETTVSNLWLLPSGPSTPSATNLLYGAHMAAMIEHLKKDYDTILIDTPPMLQIPDARVVARLADSVIMIVRASQTTRDAVTAACQRLSEDGTKILGTILNDWDPRNSPNGYYGHDNRSYSRYGAYYQEKNSDSSHSDEIKK